MANDLTFVFLSTRKAGGMERRYLNLSLYLMDRGKKVGIICTREFFEGATDRGILIPKDKVEFIDYPGKQDKLSRILRRIISIFILVIKSKKHNHLLFISNPGLYLYVISFFSMLLPKFSFIMVHSILDNYSPVYFNRLIRKAYMVDCLSDDIYKHALSMLVHKSDASKLKTAPCSFIDYSRILTKDMRKRTIDVLFLGRFIEDKGLELLEEIDSKLNDVNIHICGFGPRTPELSNAKVYSVENGFEVLSNAKIFLSIQKYENYPSQSLIEAMASGCAIIATDVGLTRNILDESCCIFIDYSSEQLILAIEQLINDPELLSSLGSTAKSKVMQNHTIEKYADYIASNLIL